MVVVFGAWSNFLVLQHWILSLFLQNVIYIYTSALALKWHSNEAAEAYGKPLSGAAVQLRTKSTAVPLFSLEKLYAKVQTQSLLLPVKVRILQDMMCRLGVICWEG